MSVAKFLGFNQEVWKKNIRRHCNRIYSTTALDAILLLDSGKYGGIEE
jgi:hypothetical protein